MVKVPKTCQKPHKVTKYKMGKHALYTEEKQRYDREQNGYNG